MKLHITQAAIDRAAAHWFQIAACANATSGAENQKYLKAQIEFVECFAILTDQTWINADAMLRSRARGPKQLV